MASTTAAPSIAIACSGYSRAQDEQQAIEAGFDALIGKPASLERVESALLAVRKRRDIEPGAL